MKIFLFFFPFFMHDVVFFVTCCRAVNMNSLMFNILLTKHMTHMNTFET